MSKNITIKEGGTGRNMTATKLKTELVGGSFALWVPEDEVQLMTKSISENGTYNAESEGKYGYSVVTVNVPGGSGSADSNGKPSGTIAPGGSGSAIAGEDSNGNDVVVGVDENGKIVITPRPYSIYIVTEPTKKEYTEGETMDYTGLVVGLKNKDGTDFTDEKYTDGHIPLSELILPDVAPEGSGNIGSATADASTLYFSDIPMPVLFAKSIAFTYVYRIGQVRWIKAIERLTASDNAWIVPYRKSNNPRGLNYVIVASQEGETYLSHRVFFDISAYGEPLEDDPQWTFYSEDSTTYNINTSFSTKDRSASAIFARGKVTGNSTNDNLPKLYNYNDGPLNIYDNPDYYNFLTWQENGFCADIWQIVTGYIASGGLVGNTADIQVIWISPYDMRSMMTEFTIKSNVPESGGTFETEGGGEHTSSSGGF